MIDILSSPGSMCCDGTINNHSSIKRRRQSDESYMMGDDENIHPQHSMISERMPDKRRRYVSHMEDNITDIPRYSQRDMQKFQHEHNCTIASIRSDFEKAIHEKTREMDDIRNKFNVAMEGFCSCQQQNVRLEEENKILKRAVAIQENRQKEQNNTNQQLRDALYQALEHIAGLERTNNNLKEMFRRSSSLGTDYISPRPPPDVF